MFEPCEPRLQIPDRAQQPDFAWTRHCHTGIYCMESSQPGLNSVLSASLFRLSYLIN